MLATENNISVECHVGTGIDVVSQSIIESYLGMESEANFNVDRHVDSPSSPPKLCDWCGNPRNEKNKRFCNVKCKGEWQKVHLKGKNNPAYGLKRPDFIENVLMHNREGRGHTKASIEGIKKGTKKWWKENPLLVAEVRQNMSKGHADFRGEKNPFYGKHHTEEVIKSIIAKKKGKTSVFKGKHHTEEVKQILREKTIKAWKNPVLRRRFLDGRVDMSLDKNPNWRGGKSFEPYGLGFNGKLKEMIRQRDGYKCMLCNKPQEDCKRRLFAHHMDYQKENCSEFNLISLCNSCHSKVNYSRNHWTAHFRKLLSKLYGYEYVEAES